MYKLHLILKYLRKRRIAWWALAAVTLCTTMVLVVISVMSGWMQMFRTAYHGLEGDITISRMSVNGFPHYEEMLGKICRLDGVQTAMPVIKTYGLINVWGQLQDGVQVEGLDLQQAKNIGDLVKGLQNQKADLEAELKRTSDPADQAALQKALDDFPSFDKRHGDDWYRSQMPNAKKVNVANWPGIILGYAVIGLSREKGNKIEHPPGLDLDKIWVHLTPLVPSSGSIPDLQNLPVQGFWLVDVSRTGVYPVDSSTAYVDFNLLQKLLQMDAQQYTTPDGATHVQSARANQIRINIKPGADLAAVASRVQAAVDEVRRDNPDLQTQIDTVKVETWEKRQGSFLSAVDHERILMLFLFGIISLVAVFLIFCIFYMIVAEKTRDIGILKSVGAGSGGVAMIFLGYGLVIGIIGGGLGLLFGYLIVHNINGIHEWLGRQLGIVVWDPKTYLFDNIPNQVNPVNAAWIVSIAVVSSVLGAILPALRAARCQPVESLRWE